MCGWCKLPRIVEETLHSPDVAEKALAHAVANQVEAAYRRRGSLVSLQKLGITVLTVD